MVQGRKLSNVVNSADHESLTLYLVWSDIAGTVLGMCCGIQSGIYMSHKRNIQRRFDRKREADGI